MRVLNAAFIILAALAHPASAHVTLETQQAVAGATYKAVLRVPHGCGGSATTAVRIRIPDGMTGVKPMPKPGWQLTTEVGKLAVPLDDGHGGQITEGVKEVIWTGQLPDEYYDEFAMRMKLPDRPGETLNFPTVQECKKGVARWIEVPEADKNWGDYAHPVPQVKLLPKS